MSKFVDFDPTRGVATYEDMYEGHMQIHYEQDVEPIIDLAKKERINGLADKTVNGKHNEMRLYARIPTVVIYEMRFKHGVDIFSRDKDQMKRAVELINREYPHLKTTEMHHAITH